MPSKMDLANKYILKFARMPSAFVKAYRIEIKRYLEDGTVENLVETVENPYFPEYYPTKITLPFVKEGKWVMPEDMIYDVDRPLKVWWNGNAVSPMYWTFSEEFHELRFMTEIRIQPDDLIEVEYVADIMTWTYNSEFSCEFYVTPVYQDNAKHTIGEHNIYHMGRVNIGQE